MSRILLLVGMCVLFWGCGPVEPLPTESVESVQDAGDVVDKAPDRAPSVATKVETRLGTTAAVAGELVSVKCEVLDQYEQPIQGVATSFSVTPEASITKTESGIKAEQLGTYQVTCQTKDGLVDETPETLAILPASGTKLDTFVTPTRILAGETAQVRCFAEDDFGNPVPLQEATIVVTPEGGLTEAKGVLTGTKTGTYQVACQLGTGPQAKRDATPVTLVVAPALPARMDVSVLPQQSHYKAGDLISLQIKVFDRYDNSIPDARIERSIQPSQGIDSNAFPDLTFVADGEYQVTIGVVGPTEGDVKLTKTLSLLADGLGPMIALESPARGAMLTDAADVTIKGKVVDAVSGLVEFSINGQPIVPDAEGKFSLVVKSKWGLNMIELTAKDKVGNVGSLTQSYIWSPAYQAVGTSRQQALLVRLHQKAFDDGDRSTLNDLASILEKVLATIKLNDLIPGTVASGSKSAVSYSVTKNGTATMGRREIIKLQAVKDGLQMELLFKDVYIPLSGRGSLSVPFLPDPSISKSFSIRASALPLSMQLKISLQKGQIDVAVTSISLNASSISVNVFGDWLGFLNGVLTDALRGTLKSKLEDAIKKAVPGPIKSFLGGINIGTSLALPAILGGQSIAIQSAPDLLLFDVDGGTLGLSMALSVAKGIEDAKLGYPLTAQTPPVWDAKAYSMGVGFSTDLLNQAAATAWYSGAFKQDITPLVKDQIPTDIPLKPTNLIAKVEATLPPVFHYTGKDGIVEVGVGDLFFSIQFDDANFGQIEATGYMTVMIGATASIDAKQVISIQVDTTPRLFGVDIQTIKGIGRNAPDMATLLKRLAPKISEILSSSIVQSLPIPRIDLSSLGSSLGIPPGTTLGILNGKVGFQHDYMTITGDLQ